MSIVTHPKFTGKQSPTSTTQEKVKPIAATRELPLELKILMYLQKGSSICSLSVVGFVLVVFGLTVCIPKTWHQEYRRLKDLQRQERQLTATNEVLKYELLQDLETNQPGLSYPKPDNTLFLTPVTVNPKTQHGQIKAEDPAIISIDAPLAY